MVRYSAEPQHPGVRQRRASSAGEKDLVGASEQLLAAAAAAESDYQPKVAPPASCPLSAIHSLSHNGPIKVENLGTRKVVADKLHERTKVSTLLVYNCSETKSYSNRVTTVWDH